MIVWIDKDGKVSFNEEETFDVGFRRYVIKKENGVIKFDQYSVLGRDDLPGKFRYRYDEPVSGRIVARWLDEYSPGK
jgi:hypothetical protein